MPYKLMHVGKWLLAVDRRATQAAYRNEQPINTCPCDHCQNYYAAWRAHLAHSPATLALFHNLGMAPEKAAEVLVEAATPEKTHALYEGYSYFVGRLVETGTGPEYAVIDDQFQVQFTEGNRVLPRQFPLPAVQMEFSHLVPWVLDDNRAALDEDCECDHILRKFYARQQQSNH
jgi:hypothetical protein